MIVSVSINIQSCARVGEYAPAFPAPAKPSSPPPYQALAGHHALHANQCPSDQRRGTLGPRRERANNQPDGSWSIVSLRSVVSFSRKQELSIPMVIVAAVPRCWPQKLALLGPQLILRKRRRTLPRCRRVRQLRNRQLSSHRFGVRGQQFSGHPCAYFRNLAELLDPPREEAS